MTEGGGRGGGDGFIPAGGTRRGQAAAAIAEDGKAPRATPQVERLETSECWTLLQEARLGRLAVIHADGAPDVFPVNFTTHEGSLFVRTARDAKLLHIAQHPLVAFEVDGETADSHWSVVVRGTAARVTSDAELRRSGVRELESWSPTAKFFAIKITANTVTGRRFPKHSGRADRLIAFEGRVHADALAGAAAPVPRRAAASRSRTTAPAPPLTRTRAMPARAERYRSARATEASSRPSAARHRANRRAPAIERNTVETARCLTGDSGHRLDPWTPAVAAEGRAWTSPRSPRTARAHRGRPAPRPGRDVPRRGHLAHERTAARHDGVRRPHDDGLARARGHRRGSAHRRDVHDRAPRRLGRGPRTSSGVPAAWAAASVIPDAANALLASFKIWNTATVGGNVCRSFAAGAMISLAVALDGTAEVWTAGGGKYTLPVADLITGNGENSLRRGEVLRARGPARARDAVARAAAQDRPRRARAIGRRRDRARRRRRRVRRSR